MSKRKSDYIAESLSEGSYGSSSMEKFVAKDEAEKKSSFFANDEAEEHHVRVQKDLPKRFK